MQKQKDDQPDSKKYEDLDEGVLDDFDDDNKLNITGGDKEDDTFDPNIQKEYEKFMKEMNPQGLQQDNMDISSLITNMLNMMPKVVPDEGQEQTKEDQQLKKKMEDMFSGLDNGNFEDMANKLLDKFMDKDMLKEPMQQTKLAYQAAFKNPAIPATDMQRYRKQYEIVLDILDALNKNPDNKQALIEKFEKMQEYGNPPQGIEHGFGIK